MPSSAAESRPRAWIPRPGPPSGLTLLALRQTRNGKQNSIGNWRLKPRSPASWAPPLRIRGNLNRGINGHKGLGRLCILLGMTGAD